MYIVGDPDQAIYEWRNANPKSFLEKMHDSEWTQLVLSENFRSSQMICNATYIFSDTIAVFRNKAYIHRSETSLSSQKGKQSEKHVGSHSEEHPVS